MDSETTIAGIDLGTSNSSIGVVKDGVVVIVTDYSGNRVIPSVISFLKSGILYGQEAKKKMVQHPENTIYHIKRILGLQYSDPTVQEEIKSVPFTITKDHFGRPIISVEFANGRQYFNVETLNDMLISYLVGLAEQYTNRKIHDIVITCPAYFTENQRRSVMDAGTVAGYNVLCVLNEPTAAAIAYGFDVVEKESLVLVYDLGGGTFDVSLMKASHNHYTVCGVDGDTHCGGMDFDRIIAGMIEEALQNQGITISKSNTRSQMRLLERAEKAKIELSVVTSTTIEDSVWGDNEEFDITRAEFERRAKKLIDKTIMIVTRLLEKTNMTTEQVDEVVLIGGSSRIPCIRHRLEELFGAEKISEKIHPEEAVARGATMRAMTINSKNDVSLLFESGMPDLESLEALDAIPDGIVISDCIPMAIGIRQYNDKMSVLFKKNQPYPCKKERKYTTAGNQTKMLSFQVYQGDSEYYYDNKLICGFEVQLGDMEPDEKMIIHITANYDENGILQIVAEDRKRNEKKVVTISRQSTNLTATEIEEMQKRVVDTQELSHELELQSNYISHSASLKQFIQQHSAELEKKAGKEYVSQVLNGLLPAESLDCDTLRLMIEWIDEVIQYFRKCV